MCMSFTDVSMDRQEAIWVQALGYADEDAGNGLGTFWLSKANHYSAYLREEYALMSHADLAAHLGKVRDMTGFDVVAAAIEAELTSRAAAMEVLTVPAEVVAAR